MRRKSSAAVDQLDPRELIARVTAEHSSPADDADGSAHTGRHRSGSPGPDTGSGTTAVTRTGAHRVPDDPRAIDDHDHDLDDGSVVVPDREEPVRRWTARRLAPLGVGAAAVLVGTLVFTLLQPGSEPPDLNAALVNDSSRRSVSDNALADGPGSGDTAGHTLADATQGATDQIGAAVAAQDAADKRTAAAAQATTDSGSDSGSDSGPSSGPLGPVAQVAGDGVQAALKLGWGAIASGDEFLGGALGTGWSAYDGPGHDGQGRRTPDAVSVQNGNLVIRGDSAGNTGGIAWGEDQKYGKWEMRAKMPQGDKQYHPVLLLWPSKGDGNTGGEIDFAETNSAADDVSFFLHYGGGSQKTSKTRLDLSEWHNYAVEWTPDAIRGYVDGNQVFESTDSNTQPPGPMHPTIQLDYFPDGGSPQPSELQVAWMRQYK